MILLLFFNRHFLQIDIIYFDILFELFLRVNYIYNKLNLDRYNENEVCKFIQK